MFGRGIVMEKTLFLKTRKPWILCRGIRGYMKEWGHIFKLLLLATEFFYIVENHSCKKGLESEARSYYFP